MLMQSVPGKLLVTLALLLPMASHAQTLTGVASVIDGDTLEIHGQRIRLYAIDSPEGSQTCQRPNGTTWRCGAAAANAMSEMIGRRTVTCQQRSKDRYHRMVAICRVGGQDIGEWMVENGWALAYKQYGQDYAATEERAMRAKRGIHASRFLAPWNYRASRK